MSNENMSKLQLFEQQLSNMTVQKQSFQSQMAEIESAMSGLKGKKTAYKIIGNIMVEQTKDNLEKDLKEKKNLAELRLKSIEKQESEIREKAKSLQKEILKDIK